MKSAIAGTAAVIAGAAAIAASALGQSAAPSTQLLRTQTAFDIVVHLPYAETAPLFGPEGERPWAGKHWDPQFLYPQPAHDEQGAVLRSITVLSPPCGSTHSSISKLATFSTSTSFPTSWSQPSTSDLRPPTRPPPGSRTYTRTALTPDGNDHVTAFTNTDKTAAKDWQQSIDTYLLHAKP